MVSRGRFSFLAVSWFMIFFWYFSTGNVANAQVFIEGQVLSSDNQPIANFDVNAFSGKCHQGHVTGYRTDETGNYSLEVPDGTYYLIANPSPETSGIYVQEWYTPDGGTLDCGSAQSVDSGSTGIDFQIETGETITGKVTDTSGNPLQGVCIGINLDPACGGQNIGGTQTDANGDYQLNVPQGSQVYLHVNPNCAGLIYVGGFYTGTDVSHDCNLAQAVSAGSTGVSIQLESAETITGKVTDTSGNPLQGVCVNANTAPVCGGTYAGGSQTDANGNYQLNVPQGSQVYINVDPNCSGLNYLGEFYNGNEGTQDCNQAQLVNSGTTGIDFVLEAAETITGNVTDAEGNPLQNVCVNTNAETACGGPPLGGTNTDANGAYQLNVSQGSLVFVSVDPNCAELNYMWEFYDGGDGTRDCNSAQGVNSGATGIDFVVQPGALITGQITDTDGNPMQNVCVNALSPDDWSWINSGHSDENGNYSIVIQPGEYRICTDVSCGDNNPPSDFEDNCWNYSQPLTVCQPGQQIPGINISLRDDYGRIYGTVTDENGNPLSGVYIDANRSRCWEGWTEGTQTDENGNYEMFVPPGTYFLITNVSRDNPRFYINEWWTGSGGTAICDDAGGVAVPADGDVEASFSLAEGFQMEGVVKLAHESDGSQKTYIDIYLDRFPGNLPDDIDSITVTGPPNGEVLYTKADLPYESPGEFFLSVDGQPELGDYFFTVKSGPYTAEYTNSQTESVLLPLPDTTTFIPQAGTTHQSLTFSWNPVEVTGKTIYYRFRIKDMDDNTVYQTSRREGMTSHTVPAGRLQPGQTYKWRVRASDNDNWVKVQTSSYSEYITFTLEKPRGDFNGDYEVDLEDVIEGLKILAGVPICGSPYEEYVARIGKITLADVLYAVQTVAGIR